MQHMQFATDLHVDVLNGNADWRRLGYSIETVRDGNQRLHRFLLGRHGRNPSMHPCGDDEGLSLFVHHGDLTVACVGARSYGRWSLPDLVASGRLWTRDGESPTGTALPVPREFDVAGGIFQVVGLWVNPMHRGNHMSERLVRLLRQAAYSAMGADHAVGLVLNPTTGLCQLWGYARLSEAPVAKGVALPDEATLSDLYLCHVARTEDAAPVDDGAEPEHVAV